MIATEMIEREDARLRAELKHEREMNEAFKQRCPDLKETSCYQQGPLKPSRYYTTAGYLIASIERERYRFREPPRCERRCCR